MKKPNAVPLVLIVVITTLLAIPSVFGTAALFDDSPMVGNKTESNRLLVLSLVGFALLFGYYATAIFKKHSIVFWLCSFLYNFGIGVVLLYWLFDLFFMAVATSTFSVSPLVILLTGWVWYVCFASLYYTNCARQLKKHKLP